MLKEEAAMMSCKGGRRKRASPSPSAAASAGSGLFSGFFQRAHGRLACGGRSGAAERRSFVTVGICLQR